MRILYIEDSISDAYLTKRAFAEQAPEIKLEFAHTLCEGLERLIPPCAFDLLLIDLFLPDGSGLEALSYVREQALPLAVVILTGSGDQESAIAAIKLGADDYLVKRNDYLVKLPDALMAAFARFRDLTELRSRILRVLYADHNAFDVDLIKRHLAHHAPHIRLTTVIDAEAALAQLPPKSGHAADFDLLLFDYRLPGMDGLELAKIVRQDRGVDLPIVLITGQGSEELAAQALNLGIDDYLAKHDGYLYELAATLEKVKRQTDLMRERALLQETNQRLVHLLATSPSILFCLKVTGESLLPVWVTENIQTMLGFSQAEALMPHWWGSQLHPDDRAKAKQSSSQILTHGSCSNEYRFLHRDGRTLVMHEELRLVTNATRSQIEVMGTWLDITESKRTEAVHLARNAVLEQIVANRPLANILEDIAGRLEVINPEMHVSILLLDSRTRRLSLGAAPSLPVFFKEAVEGLEPLEGIGSCGTAACLGEPVIVTDIDHHPYWVSYLGLTQRANLHACWSVPFKDESGQILGTFGIYYNAPRSPASEDLKLIEEFALITALAVQKVKSAEAIRQSATVFENTRDGVLITDLTPHIIAVNRAYSGVVE